MKCACCQFFLAPEQFSKSANRKSGRDPYCFACRKQKYLKNRDRILAQKREYAAKNADKIKAYILKNKEKRQMTNKEWYAKNRTANSAKVKQKRSENFDIRFIHNMRVRIGAFFKGKGKSKATKILLGCSLEEAKIHIANKFKPGMTWENYGKWHIDHIRPLSSAQNKEEAENLCHYTNLQPLWATDNLQKGNKYESFQ